MSIEAADILAAGDGSGILRVSLFGKVTIFRDIELRSILHTTPFAAVRHRGYSMTVAEEGNDCFFDPLARRTSRVSSIASRVSHDVNDASREA